MSAVGVHSEVHNFMLVWNTLIAPQVAGSLLQAQTGEQAKTGGAPYHA